MQMPPAIHFIFAFNLSLQELINGLMRLILELGLGSNPKVMGLDYLFCWPLLEEDWDLIAALGLS